MAVFLLAAIIYFYYERRWGTLNGSNQLVILSQAKWMFMKRNHISREIRKSLNQNSWWQLMTAERLTTANSNRRRWHAGQRSSASKLQVNDDFFFCPLDALRCWQHVLYPVIVSFVKLERKSKDKPRTSSRITSPLAQRFPHFQTSMGLIVNTCQFSSKPPT